MRKALDMGIREFVEPGPGEVLAGLMRKIDRSVSVRAAANPDCLEQPDDPNAAAS